MPGRGAAKGNGVKTCGQGKSKSLTAKQSTEQTPYERIYEKLQDSKKRKAEDEKSSTKLANK